MIDQDKGNIMDIKNKKYVRAIPVWGGACSSDGRYGTHFKIIQKIYYIFFIYLKEIVLKFVLRSVRAISRRT